MAAIGRPGTAGGGGPGAKRDERAGESLASWRDGRLGCRVHGMPLRRAGLAGSGGHVCEGLLLPLLEHLCDLKRQGDVCKFEGGVGLTVPSLVVGKAQPPATARMVEARP